MSKNISPRTDIGTSDLGNVYIHEFGNQSDVRYEVRCGNHTIITTDDKARAYRVANALADVDDKPEKAKK